MLTFSPKRGCEYTVSDVLYLYSCKITYVAQSISHQSCTHTHCFHSWFHGKIDRDLASKRLHAVGRPGAYLVRNSESTPGSFVLTFLDKEKRAFNYMVHHKDGLYNASGQSRRWFPSLQQLIGYYTKFSTVKQNQHLDVPVAPPDVSQFPLSSI